ncbi:hypothetical protein [Bacillus mycoides]|uniref:hypothetical protein n=1 Tax=Bacillus mycoides TaxID=1405 RepID=UPI000BF3DB98|nr:hypothetical protein [Bacillus mycoides]PGA05597.1 hypothetical protein COL71_25640 [Bacillus mycoides]
MNNLQAEYNNNVDFISVVVEDRKLNNEIRMTDDKRFLVTLENAHEDVVAGKEIKCMSNGDIERCVQALKASEYKWVEKINKRTGEPVDVDMIEVVEELEFVFKHSLGDCIEVALNCELSVEDEKKHQLTNYDLSVRIYEDGKSFVWLYDCETTEHRTEIRFTNEVEKEIVIFAKRYMDAGQEANRREKNSSPANIKMVESDKMIKDQIEVKIYTDGLEWKDTPIQLMDIYGETYEQLKENAHTVAKEISDAEKNEVRYSFVSSMHDQGHYVGSMYKLNRLG